MRRVRTKDETMTWKLLVSFRDKDADEDVLIASETFRRLIDMRYGLRALVRTLSKFDGTWKPDENWMKR